MKLCLLRFWKDDSGFIVSGETVFLFTIVVIGLIVGWVHVRNAVTAEWTDISNAINALDQSYEFHGIRSSCDSTAIVEGSALIDTAVTPLSTVNSPPTLVISEIEACLPD